jgi:glycopeptide antibiotics resistance protein
VRKFTKNPIGWIWIIYSLFVAYSSLIPFGPESIPASFSEAAQRMIAYYEPDIHISKMDILANILFYIPFGFLTAGLAIQHRFKIPLSLGLGALLSAVLSLFLEVGQVYFSARTSSIIDLFLNTASGFMGAIAAAIYFPLFHQSTKETLVHLLHEKPILLITLILGGLIFLGGLVPLDVSIQVSDIKNSVKGIQWVPFMSSNGEPFNYANLSTNFVLFVAFAFLCHLSFWLNAPIFSSFALPTVFITLCLAGMVEFIQLFIVSRTTSVTDIIVALLGGVVGGILAVPIEKVQFHRSQPVKVAEIRSVSSPSIAVCYLVASSVLLYSILVAYLLLTPLEFKFSLTVAKSKVSWGQLIPFYAYWGGTNYFWSLQDLFFTSFLFIPLGALLYFYLRHHPFARTLTILYCLLLSISIECLQFFQPNRYPDLTDILSAVAGSYLGIWSLSLLLNRG